MIISFLSFFLMMFFFDSVLLTYFSLISFYLFFLSYGGGYDGFFFSDFLSFNMVFLSLWIFMFSMMSMDMSSSSFLVFLFMLFFSVMSFFSSFYVVFYFSFEIIFIFMFLFLINWGSTAERYQASFYMFFYTLIFSLPFLFMLLEMVGSFSGVFFLDFYFSYSGIFWCFMFLVFMVKLPLYGFHLWLPKAHVEAPVSGSMILAGVLLKLGGYGLLRFLPFLKYLNFFTSFFLDFCFYLSVYGCLLTSFLCVRQMDLKMMIAYSSVVHMSVMMMGVLSFSSEGVYGAIIMMIAHGFISPLLFFLMTKVYNVKSSRSLMVLKGGIIFSPLLCFFWFLTSSLNLSVPPFMSFFSEISIFGSMGFLGYLEWLLMFFCCFFTGVYCIYMYVVLTHGKDLFSLPMNLSFSNFFLCFSHLYYVVFFPFFFFTF